MCIDESLLSTLCGSNVIPVTPPMTTTKEEEESRGPRVAGVRGRGVILNGRNAAVDEGAALT